MPYAYCLAPVGWSCFLMSSIVLCLISLLNAAQLLQGFGFCSLFYLGCFTLHPGIACLGCVHHGIASLASQASDWAGALWDNLSGLWLASHC